MSGGSRDSAGGDKSSNPARFINNNRDYTDVYHIVCGNLTSGMSGGLRGGGAIEASTVGLLWSMVHWTDAVCSV